MSGVTIGFLMGGLVLVLLVIRVHIAVAMLLAGGIGYALVAGIDPLFNYAKTMAFARYSVYDLSVVPLFLLMGNLASRGGLSRRLFQATNAFLGHYRGGVAMSAVGACAGFGAICGSSLATGALAAGGTLGVLIPPSVVLVIYAVLAEQNVAAMFIAALLPGLLALSGYMIAIMIYVRLAPGSGPAAPRMNWSERLRTLREVWPIVAIFVTVIGGIYGGIFTPTEAAAIGTMATS